MISYLILVLLAIILLFIGVVFLAGFFIVISQLI